MSNWVADFLTRNPDQAALGVYKRARHSLHVRQPDGTILAQFTGSPCHFLDGAEWKPLDTRLLLDSKSGGYYVPGVPVTLTEDGLVSLGTTWTQKTNSAGLYTPTSKAYSPVEALPAKGAVDDDTLRRSGPGWEHILRVTENGLREEYILTEPPKELGKAADMFVLETVVKGDWIDGEVGVFAKEGMEFSEPRAWDAKGEQLPCKRWAKRDGITQYLYTGIPSEALAAAAYPVVIDPDFAGSTADMNIGGVNATYDTARSTSADRSTTYTTLTIGQHPSSYWVYRAFIKFDTSTITPNTVSQVNLKLTPITDTSDADFDVNIIKCTWDEGISQRENNYDRVLTSSEDSSIWRNTNGISANTQYASGNLDTTWVDIDGTTYYALASNLDYDGSGTAPTVHEYITVASQDHATAGYRPVLTVAYSAAATGDPGAWVAVQRRRNSNLRR
jgi:hypothetical protein